MAGTQLNFSLKGLDDTARYIAEMERRAENTQPLMLAIAHEGLQQTLRRFDAQQDPSGKAWVPSMAAKRAKRKTLIDTGHFKGNTFSSEATAKQATWGTNAVQGRIFQLGGIINMPAREGTARLRLQRDGTLMRQGEGKLSRLAVFAKASHKRVKSVDYKAGPYTITVVARPFLGVNAADLKTFDGIVEDYFFDGLSAS